MPTISAVVTPEQNEALEQTALRFARTKSQTLGALLNYLSLVQESDFHKEEKK